MPTLLNLVAVVPAFVLWHLQLFNLNLVDLLSSSRFSLASVPFALPPPLFRGLNQNLLWLWLWHWHFSRLLWLRLLHAVSMGSFRVLLHLNFNYNSLVRQLLIYGATN